MAPGLDSLENDFESIAREAQTLTFLGRAIELQEQARKRIETFLEKLAERKQACVSSLDEAGANAILAMELSLRVACAELSMWIKLKQDDPEKAWDELVTAQVLCGNAAAVRRQIGKDSAGLTNLLTKLLFVERWLFPPQMFNSVGGIVGRRECSACGGDYESCGHVRGRAYMGQLCHTIVQEMQVREVSIVTNPANKHCRITHFSDQGKMRNKMTWRLEER